MTGVYRNWGALGACASPKFWVAKANVKAVLGWGWGVAGGALPGFLKVAWALQIRCYSTHKAALCVIHVSRSYMQNAHAQIFVHNMDNTLHNTCPI